MAIVLTEYGAFAEADFHALEQSQCAAHVGAYHQHEKVLRERALAAQRTKEWEDWYADVERQKQEGTYYW